MSKDIEKGEKLLGLWRQILEEMARRKLVGYYSDYSDKILHSRKIKWRDWIWLTDNTRVRVGYWGIFDDTVSIEWEYRGKGMRPVSFLYSFWCKNEDEDELYPLVKKFLKEGEDNA